MKKKSPKDKIQEILQSRSFQELERFIHPKKWEAFDEETRELLGLAFVARGEEEFRQSMGDPLGSFKIATKVAPKNLKILLKQAEMLVGQHEHLPSLKAACKALKQAARLEPKSYEAWSLWGRALMLKGAYCQEATYLQEAQDKFEEAQKLMQKESETKLDLFHWQWGRCWYLQGILSGEATDFFSALEHFQKACHLGCRTARFWNEYGNVLIELGCLLSRNDLFSEAVACYERATVEKEDFYEGKLNLACTYHRLFEIYPSTEIFTQAQESFENACAIREDDPVLWCKWGILLAEMARMKKDITLLKNAEEKFSRADALEPNHPHILMRWAEVEMCLGGFYEDLPLLLAAFEKMSRSVEIMPEQPEFLFLSGNCLMEIGRYFNDADYYLRAIEKYRLALSLNRKDPLIWHGLSLAYFSIGEMNGEIEKIEKSIQLFSRVAEFGGEGFPKFWNDWGVASMRLAEITGDEAILESAIYKFEKALQKQSSESPHSGVDSEWVYNYGCALDFLGDIRQDPSFYEKAVYVLGQIVQIEPDYYNARYNLGLALTHLGEAIDDLDSLKRADEQFKILSEQDPEDESLWNEWGMNLIVSGRLMYDPAQPKYAVEMFQKAEEAFHQSLKLGGKQSLYNLACLHSIVGNINQALDFLEKAKEAKTLPPIEDMLHDDWLETLHNCSAFRVFISKSYQEKSPFNHLQDDY